MSVEIFIENETGSKEKNIFDEKALEFEKSVPVSRAYPYPYGFVLGTTAEDGDNVDCFVITSQKFSTGDTVECEPIALMEQLETSWSPDSNEQEIDHNVIAVPAGEAIELSAEIKNELSNFITHVFDHVDDKKVEVGDFLNKKAAIQYIESAQG